MRTLQIVSNVLVACWYTGISDIMTTPGLGQNSHNFQLVTESNNSTMTITPCFVYPSRASEVSEAWVDEIFGPVDDDRGLLGHGGPK